MNLLKSKRGSIWGHTPSSLLAIVTPLNVVPVTSKPLIYASPAEAVVSPVKIAIVVVLP